MPASGEGAMTIVAVVEDCLARGEPVTVDRLGGLKRIDAERDLLLTQPFLDVLVELTATSASDAQTFLAELLIEGFACATSPVAFRDAANALIETAVLRDKLAKDLVPVLTTRIAVRSDPATQLIAAYALEALFRLSLAGAVTHHRILAIMSEFDGAEGELFAEHAAKLVGVAFDQWGGDDLVASLERLVASAEAEAAYELGHVMLAGALQQDCLAEILGRLEGAKVRFHQATIAGEERADATAYEAVIDLVRGFWAGLSAAELQIPLDRLGAAMADRRSLLQVGSVPAWLAPRIDREIAWVDLARGAQKAAQDISRPSWLNAAATMEHLLTVYDAERTISGSPGLSTMLRPRIEAAFVREQGLAAHLDDLLADPESRSIDAVMAGSLRTRIHRRIEKDTDSRKAEENVAFPLLTSVLQGLPSADELPRDTAAVLERELAQRHRGFDRIANPVINRIFAELTSSLVDCADYQGDIRDDYDAALFQILGFCADRQDAGRKQLGPRGDYLRDPLAKEGDLQSDLRQWLKGNLTSADVQTEMEGVATGRTDLYIGFGGHRFIAELKRHHGYVDEAVAMPFFGQAGAYQATNVRLGFLGILELVDRPGPPATIEECFWSASFVPEGSQLARHITVFRVPGMLKSPSSLN
jgi:hypothetical protein